MEGCQIVEQGTYEELMTLNARFADFIRYHETDDTESSSSSSSSSEDVDQPADVEKHKIYRRQRSQENTELRRRKRAVLERAISLEAEKKLQEKRAEEKEEEDEEEYRHRSVSCKTMLKYRFLSGLC